MYSLDWQQIDTVFLDLDGTLLDLHFDNYFWLEHVPQRYAEKQGLNLTECKAILYPKMRALRGQLKWYSIDFWSAELGLPLLQFKYALAHLIAARPYVHEFLTALRHRHKQVVLFTNAHQDTLELKMQQVPLSPYFDQIITSHQLGMAKEARGAWSALAKMQAFDKTKSLFIDDNFSVLDEAKRYGIGNLLGIKLPDLSGEPLQHASYQLLDCYREIMPTETVPT